MTKTLFITGASSGIGAATARAAAKAGWNVGLFARSEPYWHWLISRRGFDRIYVAIDGPDRFRFDERRSPMVGYAVTKDERILELMTQPNHEEAGIQLLTRVCGDAIEQDFHELRLDAPPQTALHQVFTQCGGETHYGTTDHGHVLMVKLLNSQALLNQTSESVRRRIAQAQCDLPCGLGFATPTGKLRINVTDRAVTVESGRTGRSFLRCQASDVPQMLLGHYDVSSAFEQGTLTASTREAERVAQIIFPERPLWYSPLDFVPAS